MLPIQDFTTSQAKAEHVGQTHHIPLLQGVGSNEPELTISLLLKFPLTQIFSSEKWKLISVFCAGVKRSRSLGHIEEEEGEDEDGESPGNLEDVKSRTQSRFLHRELLLSLLFLST